LPKRYRAKARLGVATDTQDRTGVPIRVSRHLPDEREIEAAIEALRSLTRQRPPLYSAVKVRGERLYKAARRGEAPEPDERPIRVYHLAVLDNRLPDLELDLTVSRGTYVRTLAHDLGEMLGCGAHLVSLRRLASGPFEVDHALSPVPGSNADASEFRARAKTPAEALSHLSRVTLTEEESARLRHGIAPAIAPERIVLAPLSFPLPPDEAAWPVALLTPEGEVLALARVRAAAAPIGLLRVFP
jgi:tRNA pseudouridine55 synthase